MSKRTAVLAPIAIMVAIGATIWLIGRIAPNNSESDMIGYAEPKISSGQVDFSKIEAAALNSCLCRRTGGSDKKCETIYARARDALLEQIYGGTKVERDGVAATSCAPVSSTTECFNFTDRTKCIDLGFDVVVASQDLEVREVCTINEARAIEQAYEQGWLGPDGQEPNPDNEAEWGSANRRSNEAVNEMLRRILAGEAVPEATLEGGCTG